MWLRSMGVGLERQQTPVKWSLCSTGASKGSKMRFVHYSKQADAKST